MHWYKPMAMTHRMMMEVITMLSWKRWWARMTERTSGTKICPLYTGERTIPYAVTAMGSYSMDLRDSAMLIFSSLKYMKPFTSMAKIKVNKRLSR